MQQLTPVILGVLVVVVGGVQTWINVGRFGTLERRMEAHEQANDRRFEQLGAEIAQLRSDLLQVVLAGSPRPQTG